MTKIDLFSGFLGAGKTTLIKKLIAEAYTGEKLVIIENEFGDISIDGGFLQEAGVQIREMNAGCICCSLVGDFKTALLQVYRDYAPDRILIEPSGVGKLSDVIRAVEGGGEADLVLNGCTTVVDAKKCKMYMKNFGEFFNDQLQYAKTIVLSHTDSLSEEKINDCIALLKEKNTGRHYTLEPAHRETDPGGDGAAAGSSVRNRSLSRLRRRARTPSRRGRLLRSRAWTSPRRALRPRGTSS